MGKDTSPWRTSGFDPIDKIRFPGYGRKRPNSTLYPFFEDGSNSCLVPSPSLPGFDQSARNPKGEEDAYDEDPEDIDALLYSDSDNESEASTGHSPVSNTVAGSSAVLAPSPPPKRRRVEPELELDPSLADTASSTVCGTKSKRERIKESVGVIRRLIPGWRNAKRKDAMSVLDEAIKYLNSLRLKTKEFGVRSE